MEVQRLRMNEVLPHEVNSELGKRSVEFGHSHTSKDGKRRTQCLNTRLDSAVPAVPSA